MYSAQLLDHFEHPRNAGEVPDADSGIEIQNPVCGDVLRLTLKLEGEQIADIRFKAKGCVPSIACASAMTELVLGKTIQDARAIRREALVGVVGGLPQASTHAAQLALDALSAILDSLPRASSSAVVEGSSTK
jgi:nitrogen fixation protein NifU and related proteins